MKKKFYILCVLLFVLSINVFPDGTEPSGDGSVGSPYQVSTLNHLLWISTNTGSWDKYFEQTADIDASATSGWNAGAGFSPIGTTSTGFTGTYNGNGYEISHLTSNRPSELYIGLFGYIKESNISNLGIVSVNLNGKKYMGALAGYATRATITNCYSSGTIQAVYPYVGGLVGLTYGANGPPEGQISYCYSTCSISSESNHVGGLVGQNGSDNEIINSYASGSVSGEGDYIGGLVGENRDEALIYQCYASGSVTGESHIGGLVGYNNIESWVLNCYSTGDVHISDLVGSTTDAAGFCGRNYNSNIRFCYSTGDVINDHASVSNPDDKGFLGVKSGVMSVYLDNNFFDNTSSNQSSDGANAATEKTNAAMVNLSTFTDETTVGLDIAWDFVGTENDDSNINDYWEIIDGSGRPFLSWENRDMTWLGTNTNWNDLNNWSGSMELPTPFKDIIIPSTANNPIISSGVGADCHNLTINASASLSVNSGGSFITAGSITNNGTFNYQRSISNGQWHLIASPVSGAVSGMFDGDYLQTWDEPTHTWSDVTTTDFPLGTAEGFGFWSDDGTTTHTFDGTPNTGNQSTTITYDGSAGSYDGANLLGNPYPSSIDWSGLDDTYGAIYYLKSDGTYDNWNNGSATGSATQYVAPTQGFFIVISAGGTFNVGNSDRSHNGATTYYKAKSNIENGLILKTPNGDLADELWIAFNESTTEEFDFTSDAFQFFSGNNGISHLYSIANNRNLSIDIRPETNLILLGFRNNANGDYQIGIKNINGISSAIIEDTKTEIFHNLQNGDYEFAWNINDEETRFILHLKVTGIDDFPNSTTQIFAYQKTINIRSNEKLNNTQISIIDMMGRVVYEQNLVDGQNESINLPLEDGVYLVQLVSDSGTQLEKVILR